MRVGVLGGGQLGRMLALAGYPLGLHFRFLDPAPASPAGQMAECLPAAFDDAEALARFADGLEVVTYEFENVPAPSVRDLARRVPVSPPPEALETAQDRLSEKTLFQRLGIPVPPFAPVETQADLEQALARIGLPAVLKTRRFGYDGKGQRALRAAEEASAAWEALGGKGLIVEGFVDFEREVSILAVRGRDGATAFYPLVENHHAGGILRLSLAPAPALTPELQARAQDYAARVLDALNYVGVLAIEFFQQGGQLYANEMAPRVHNSGHWTIEGAETSQFENHLRAVLGLPLGSTQAIGYSAMINLIGTTPEPAAILALPQAHLHLYGKSPRPGRKLGHITLRADDRATVETQLARLRALA
ncbi:MAG TPA: 5-(carboxyamino)imidazole ribonucleotide synthase [Chthonomonadaceae bacterium]|nr:5-(carboxyamino)imidazole ribonucleotide synthase [Chthonomonadaceae bacterium]